MFKKTIALLTSVFILLLAVNVCAEAVFSEVIELDSDISSWKLYYHTKQGTNTRAELEDETLGSVTIVEDSQMGSVLKIEDTSNDLLVRAERKISDLSGKYIIEYDINPQKDSGLVFACGEYKYDQDANSNFFHIMHRSDDKIEVRGSTTFTSGEDFELGKWHHIKIIIDTVKCTFVVYADDTRLGTSYSFRFPSGTTSNSNPLNKIIAGTFFNTNADIQTSLLLDNFKISEASLASFGVDSKVYATRNFGEYLTLNWTGAEDASYYNIYQDGVKIAQVSYEYTSYLVENLVPGKEYEFSVQAVDEGEMETLDGPSAKITAFVEKQHLHNEDFDTISGVWTLYSHTGSTNSRTLLTDSTLGTLENPYNNNGNKQLRVIDKSSDKIIRAEQNLTGFEGLLRLEYDIIPSDQSIVVIGDGSKYESNSNNYFVHIAHRGTKIEVRGSSTTTSTQTFALNKLHHVSVIIDTNNKVANVYVDDIHVGQNIGFRYSANGLKLNKIVVGSFYSVSYENETLVDNIGIYKVGNAKWNNTDTLSVENTNGSSVTAMWPSATGDVNCYLVYFDNELVDIVEKDVLDYTFNGLEPTKSHSIKIVAVDNLGVGSAVWLSKTVKVYNPFEFSLEIEKFCTANSQENEVDKIEAGALRAKVKITNDNSLSDTVTLAAFVYAVEDDALTLSGVWIKPDIKVSEGNFVNDSIDFTVNGDSKKYRAEICLIDTVSGIKAYTLPAVLE